MDLKKLFLDGMESTEAQDAIIAILEKFEGQEISYELVIKIRPMIANRKDHAEVIFDSGLLRVVWKNGHIVIGKSGSVINIEKIKKSNRSEFRDIEKRNERRRKALESEDFDRFEKMLEMLAFYKKMSQEMEEAIEADLKSEGGIFAVECPRIRMMVDREVERLKASGKNPGKPLESSSGNG